MTPIPSDEQLPTLTEAALLRAGQAKGWNKLMHWLRPERYLPRSRHPRRAQMYNMHVDASLAPLLGGAAWVPPFELIMRSTNYLAR